MILLCPACLVFLASIKSVFASLLLLLSSNKHLSFEKQQVMGSSAVDVGLRVERLNGSNYPNWKFKVRMVLTRDELWEIVSGEEVADPASSLAWKRKDNKALSTICLLVDDTQLVYVRNAKSAKEAWDALQFHYEKPSLTNKLYLRKKMLSLRLEKNGDMQAHINSVVNTAEQLRSAGENVADADIMTTLLCSLHDGYDPLITALESRPDSDLTLEFVKSRLMHESVKIGRSFDESEKAFKAKKFERGKQEFKKKEKSQLRCFGCNGVGHFKVNCPKRNQDKSKSQSAEATATTSAMFADSSYCFSASSYRVDKYGWFVDSGCTNHMSSNRDWFSDLVPVKVQVSVADDRVVMATGKGTVMFYVMSNGKNQLVELSDTLYVPSLQGNLFSVSRATGKGFQVEFHDNQCLVKKNNQEILRACKVNNLYRIDVLTETARYANGTTSEMDLWHCRLGHINDMYMKSLLKSQKLKFSDSELSFCEACCFGKMSRQKFPKNSEIRSNQVLDLLHSDLCGPMSIESKGRQLYFLSIIDDYSRFAQVYFIRHKSETLDKFREFVTLVSNQHGRQVKAFRSDNGTEFGSKDFVSFLSNQGIKIEKTVPYTPQQNGVAERFNRTVVEMARTLLNHAGLDKTFWAEAVNTAVYLRNRLPCRSIGGKSPYERWYKKIPNIQHLRTFGCVCYSHIPKEQRKKLDVKASKCILLGYDVSAKAYRLYCLDTSKIIVSRDVKFNERSFLHSSGSSSSSQSESSSNSSELVSCSSTSNSSSDSGQVTSEVFIDSSLSSDNSVSSNNAHQTVQHCESSSGDNSTIGLTESGSVQAVRQSSRINKGVPPSRYEAATYLTMVEDCPINWQDAMKSRDAQQWKKAALAEFNSLTDNQTWSLVQLPADKKAIGCKWVFSKKLDESGDVERFKARLVAKGYAQVPGLDFEDTFAPVAKYSTLRLFLTLAASLNMEIVQMDVSTAFLHGVIDEDLYMDQPEGFIDLTRADLVCKLHKSLYGLRQAPRQWYKTITKVLTENGYVKCPAEDCLFTKVTSIGKVYLIIYVDDIMIAAESSGELEKSKQLLSSNFTMKDLGSPSRFLGVSIERDRPNNCIYIHQHAYIESVLKRFGFDESRPVSTPQTTNNATNQNENTHLNFSYREAIGALMYIMVLTRPDLASAIGFLSRRLDKPEDIDRVTLKRVLRYLRGTILFKLKLGQCNSNIFVKGFVDADWGGDHDDRKSTSGYVFFINDSAISWLSKKQTTVALSTTEAEYVAASCAAQEAVWLRNVLICFGFEQKIPTTLCEDNQSCIKIASNVKTLTRIKHLDIKLYFVKDLVDRNVLKFEYCSTTNMVADIFTKPLPTPQFTYFVQQLGLK